MKATKRQAELIEQLKHNDLPVYALSEEMREVFRFVGLNGRMYRYDGNWKNDFMIDTLDISGRDDVTYRIRPDFQCEVEPDKCPWNINDICHSSRLIVKYKKTGHVHVINCATHSGVFMCGFGSRKILYAELQTDFEQLDGSPCECEGGQPMTTPIEQNDGTDSHPKSDTPRSDQLNKDMEDQGQMTRTRCWKNHARQLETELTQVKAERDAARESLDEVCFRLQAKATPDGYIGNTGIHINSIYRWCRVARLEGE